MSKNDRWHVLNQIVDFWGPKCQGHNATFKLLVYYFRHSYPWLIGNPAHEVQQFRIGDSVAAKDLGVSRQTVRRLRLKLLKAGALQKVEIQGKGICYIVIVPH